VVQNAWKATLGPELGHGICGDVVTWRRGFDVAGGDEMTVEQLLGGLMSRRGVWGGLREHTPLRTVGWKRGQVSRSFTRRWITWLLARSRQIGLKTVWHNARLSAVPDPLWWQDYWHMSMHG